jgi:hypothetical protein
MLDRVTLGADEAMMRMLRERVRIIDDTMARLRALREVYETVLRREEALGNMPLFSASSDLEGIITSGRPIDAHEVHVADDAALRDELDVQMIPGTVRTDLAHPMELQLPTQLSRFLRLNPTHHDAALAVLAFWGKLDLGEVLEVLSPFNLGSHGTKPRDRLRANLYRAKQAGLLSVNTQGQYYFTTDEARTRFIAEVVEPAIKTGRVRGRA